VFTIRSKGAKLFDGTFGFSADGLQLIFAILLLILGIIVAVSGIQKLTQKTEA
jgi:carbon starvation protein